MLPKLRELGEKYRKTRDEYLGMRIQYDKAKVHSGLGYTETLADCLKTCSDYLIDIGRRGHEGFGNEYSSDEERFSENTSSEEDE